MGRKADARDYFSEAELSRARRFRRGQRVLMLAGTALDTGVLVALARRPPRRSPAVVAAGLGAGLTALGLPLSAVTRVRARRVGLVTQGWRGWAGDLAKAQAISALLSAAAGTAVVAGMRRFGDDWWQPAAGGLVGAGVLSLVAAPTLLDPIFNSFTPAEPELRARVGRLADAAGVPVDRVLVMDASRRTTASNAYVTGLGPTKRVVLFDTLLRNLADDEVDFVVAHELAHMRHRDLYRSLARLAVAAPALTWAIAHLSRAGTRYPPPPPPHRVPAHDKGPPDGDALPALILAAGAVSIPFRVLDNAFTRRMERRADAFAMRLTGDPRAQISLWRELCVRNVAEPEPPRWVRVLSGSHPTPLERIGMAEEALRSAS